MRVRRVVVLPAVLAGTWGQVWPAQIPVPGISTNTSARVLQRLELQAFCRNANASPVCEELRLVRGDEMRHRSAFPHMPVQPEAAVYGVEHSIPPSLELAIRRSCVCASY